MFCTNCLIRASTKSRACTEKQRTVPRNWQLSGSTFSASPACTCVIDSTTDSDGLTFRDTMVCSAVPIWKATWMASMP